MEMLYIQLSIMLSDVYDKALELWFHGKTTDNKYSGTFMIAFFPVYPAKWNSVLKNVLFPILRDMYSIIYAAPQKSHKYAIAQFDMIQSKYYLPLNQCRLLATTQI